MGIDRESETPGSLQIGPTSEGMVRIYVEGDGVDLPLDFDPEEAEEIAEELRLAAEAARRTTSGPKVRPRADKAGTGPVSGATEPPLRAGDGAGRGPAGKPDGWRRDPRRGR